jgi:glutamate-1-semialdehyde 2,1-aminomutase
MSFERSSQLLERARKVLAGGVSSGVRKSELPHPLFFTLGRGSRIRDVDGNEYADYVLGQGPLILGHQPETVLEAVRTQLNTGLIYAAQQSPRLTCLMPLRRCCRCAREREKARLTRFEKVSSTAG